MIINSVILMSFIAFYLFKFYYQITICAQKNYTVIGGFNCI